MVRMYFAVPDDCRNSHIESFDSDRCYRLRFVRRDNEQIYLRIDEFTDLIDLQLRIVMRVADYNAQFRIFGRFGLHLDHHDLPPQVIGALGESDHIVTFGFRDRFMTAAARHYTYGKQQKQTDRTMRHDTRIYDYFIIFRLKSSTK